MSKAEEELNWMARRTMVEACEDAWRFEGMKANEVLSLMYNIG